MKRIFLLAAIVCGVAASRAAAAPPEVFASPVWQWSVPAPTIPDRRALLWISPDTPRVRGLVVACQNMIEKPLFERDDFRAVCAENGLGLVLIYSGHDAAPDDGKNPDHPKRSSLDIFLNPNYPQGSEDPKECGEDLQKVLDALAAESGYAEVRYAPLCPVGHSSAGPFVWHLYKWNPARIFAMLPFKTGAREDGPEGIPVFEVNSEWFDYGHASNRCWAADLPAGSIVKARNGGKTLYGTYTDVGSGHCSVSDDSIPMFALFLKKAVAARIPANAPPDAPVPLIPLRPESGWLLDASTFGKPGGRPLAYAEWKGNRASAYWYLDRELAAAVQDHMVAQLAKKPQQLGFLDDKGAASPHGGTFSFSPKFLDDQGTFSLEARYVDHLTDSNLFRPDQRLENSGDPVFYKVNSGGVVQVGPHTFRVRPHYGPLVPQGNPWEPTLIAYTKGNAAFQPTEKPAHANLSIVNHDGAAQTLDFQKIGDQRAAFLAPLKLAARTSSGLPAQFFPVSGPIQIEGNTLRFTKLPARAKYPIRVLVGAFQWGRPDGQKVQSAGPVMQEFFIQK